MDDSRPFKQIRMDIFIRRIGWLERNAMGLSVEFVSLAFIHPSTFILNCYQNVAKNIINFAKTFKKEFLHFSGALSVGTVFWQLHEGIFPVIHYPC